MPTTAEQEAIQQTVTDLFNGYDFGKPPTEDTEVVGTSQEQSTTLDLGNMMATDETAATYALLNLDLASHAAEFARYNLLYMYSPWNQTEASPNQAYFLPHANGLLPTTDAQSKKPPAKRERDEITPTEQPSTERSQKRTKAMTGC
ncbi:uncharacterized protein FIESC28_03738 [Fusarium coffeatum]|uniref:Uncharacterized protein n=1 Tax=Fusarium coffeatum TaxID=231269 RepID=A0A366S4E3_9HYPO|nr:uncharacterized protein FIESC28_03738 [Fusarium coffeatum]RBR23556.1 hypothetical protein FIESC28_03738 [Fusarium coffeatum]